MRGARVGEQDEIVVGAPRWRRRVLAGSIVAALLVIFVGGAVTSDFFNAYPRGACKGVGYGSLIGDLSEGGPPGHETPEAALAAFAPQAPRLGPLPLPADGWEEYRGRWVRNMGDRSYYEMDVYEGPNGWVAGGDFMICGR